MRKRVIHLLPFGSKFFCHYGNKDQYHTFPGRAPFQRSFNISSAALGSLILVNLRRHRSENSAQTCMLEFVNRFRHFVEFVYLLEASGTTGELRLEVRCQS